MIRYLYLLRHAKSDWDDPDLDDHERPLAPRGRRAAKAMARHLRDAEIHPSLVLCSSATRARQTLERVLPSLGDDVRIEVEDGLYTFDSDVVLRRLRRVPAANTSILIVGHNPALADLTETLAGAGRDLGSRVAKFPTGAFAVLAVPVAWSRLRPGGAELVSFVAPRDLP